MPATHLLAKKIFFNIENNLNLSSPLRQRCPRVAEALAEAQALGGQGFK